MLEVSGDLLDATETYLCHQTNCVSRGSKHLAKSVFTRFPYADIYTARSTPSVPGSIIIRGDEEQRLVIGMLGQYYPGSKYPNSKKDGRSSRVSYFTSCLEKMKSLEGDFAFPWRIGCGAAGGDWDLYHNLILKFSEKIDGKVCIYKLPLPEQDPEFKTLF